MIVKLILQVKTSSTNGSLSGFISAAVTWKWLRGLSLISRPQRQYIPIQQNSITGHYSLSHVSC